MNTTIPVYVRQVYGCPKVYAADSEQAQALAALTGCRTLEHRHTQALEALGFTVNVVPDPKGAALPARG